MGKLLDYSLIVFIDDHIIGQNKGRRQKKETSYVSKKKNTTDSYLTDKKEEKTTFVPDTIKTMYNSFDNVIKDLHPDIFRIVKMENIRKIVNNGNKVIVFLDYFRFEIENKNDNKKEYVVFAIKNIVDDKGNILLKKGEEFLRINDDSKTKRMQEILDKTPKDMKLFIDLGMQFFENKERAIFIRKNIRLRINKFPDKSVFELILTGTEPYKTAVIPVAI